MLLREELEERGVGGEELERRVAQHRAKLVAEAEAAAAAAAGGARPGGPRGLAGLSVCAASAQLCCLWCGAVATWPGRPGPTRGLPPESSRH